MTPRTFRAPTNCESIARWAVSTSIDLFTGPLRWGSASASSTIETGVFRFEQATRFLSAWLSQDIHPLTDFKRRTAEFRGSWPTSSGADRSIHPRRMAVWIVATPLSPEKPGGFHFSKPGGQPRTGSHQTLPLCASPLSLDRVKPARDH